MANINTETWYRFTMFKSHVILCSITSEPTHLFVTLSAFWLVFYCLAQFMPSSCHCFFFLCPLQSTHTHTSLSPFPLNQCHFPIYNEQKNGALTNTQKISFAFDEVSNVSSIQRKVIPLCLSVHCCIIGPPHQTQCPEYLKQWKKVNIFANWSNKNTEGITN